MKFIFLPVDYLKKNVVLTIWRFIFSHPATISEFVKIKALPLSPRVTVDAECFGYFLLLAWSKFGSFYSSKCPCFLLFGLFCRYHKLPRVFWNQAMTKSTNKIKNKQIFSCSDVWRGKKIIMVWLVPMMLRETGNCTPKSFEVKSDLEWHLIIVVLTLTITTFCLVIWLYQETTLRKSKNIFTLCWLGTTLGSLYLVQFQPMITLREETEVQPFIFS